MKKLITILFLVLSSLFTQAQPLSSNINSTPGWHTVINYKRIGNNLYVSYRDYEGDIPSYYVSSSTGNDLNNGLTESTPFASLTKVNTLNLAGSRKRVLFKAGDEWVGTISVNYSGTSTNNVTYDMYGTGNKPKIYGSAPITGWIQTPDPNDNPAIYQATFSTQITQLFDDGVRMMVARYVDPAVVPSGRTSLDAGYSWITGVTSNTQITIDAPVGTPTDYFKGCTILLRVSNKWIVQKRTVVSSVGNVLTLTNVTGETLVINRGAVLMDTLTFLTLPGEWVQQGSTVYYWAADGQAPTNVRGSTYDYGVNLTLASNQTRENVTIKNLNFLQQKINGIYTYGGSQNNITITDCDFSGSVNGINIQTYDAVQSQYHRILNNDISDMTAYGIVSYNAYNGLVENNDISDIGLFSSWGLGSNVGTGIEYYYGQSVSQTTTIKNNVATNTGYHGIFWKCKALIKNNYVNKACMSLMDGGGIYSSSLTSTGSIIEWNVVDSVLGNRAGSNFDRNLGIAIYIDNGTHDNTVRNNVAVKASDTGIFLHLAYNHSVSNNLVFSNRYAFASTLTPMLTSRVDSNIFITNSASDTYEPRHLLAYRNSQTGVTFDYNKYINAFTSDLVFKTGIAYPNQYKLFSDWQVYISGDANSTYNAGISKLTAGEIQKVFYNVTSTDVTYINGIGTDENGTTITSFTLVPFSGKYMKGTAANINAFTIQ